MLKQAYINEIRWFIQEEKARINDDKNIDKGWKKQLLYKLKNITEKDIENIAEEMIEDDYLNEILNNTINEYIYK